MENIIEGQNVVNDDVAYADAVYIAMEMGESIIACGGEISRAEDTVTRICKAYGATSVDVGIIMSVAVLNVDFDGVSINSSRRVHEVATNNLGKLAKLNALSRKICATKPSKEEFMREIQSVNKKSSIPLWQALLGAVLTGSGFAVFFGGDITDALLAAVIALPMTLLGIYLSKLKMNPIVAKFFVCFLGGACAMAMPKLGISCHPGMMMVGNIMAVVPGVLMTNSFRDLFSGDIMSGFFRLCTAVLDTVAIACGYAAAMLLIGGAV